MRVGGEEDEERGVGACGPPARRASRAPKPAPPVISLVFGARRRLGASLLLPSAEVGVSGRAEGPPLTCLHARDAGGVKHPLPLSGAQRNLVRQQVNLTQRPAQNRDNRM